MSNSTPDFQTSIDTRLLTGKTQGVFVTQDHERKRYVRDPNCWAGDIDLSAFSVFNSLEGARRAGTLIASDAILLAAHYPLDVGTTVRFVRHEFKGDLNHDGVVDFADLTLFARSAKQDEPDYFARLSDIARNFNTTRVVERTIVSTSRATAPDMPAMHDDLLLARLDRPVRPEHIRPVPLLWPAADLGPRNWWDVWAKVPACSLNQHRQLLVSEIRRDAIARDGWLEAGRPMNLPRSRFYGGLNPGDSGCPVFLVGGNQPVLLYCARRGSPSPVPLVSAPPGAGPFAGAYARAIHDTLLRLGCDASSLRVARSFAQIIQPSSVIRPITTP